MVEKYIIIIILIIITTIIITVVDENTFRQVLPFAIVPTQRFHTSNVQNYRYCSQGL